MKKFVLIVICSLLSVSLGLPNVQYVLRSQTKPKALEHKTPQVNKVNADLCPLCIQFTGQAINQLLNIILNVGVVGTCGQLCQLLAEKTGSQLLGAACTILCDVEGVQEFVKLIQEADLDPIYFCELLKTCPIFDGGDAVITKISVSPQSGPQGERQILFNYVSKNGTGTGEIIVAVETVDGIPIENGFLQEPLPAGAYNKSLTLKAEPDPACDPTQEPCEMWYPGNYTVRIDICNGECGSKHPHSKVYDRKTANFTISNGFE